MIEYLKNKLQQRTMGINTEGTIKNYSVLVPLVFVDNDWKILFERRSKYIKQSYDISFPGGRVEENETFEEAAIRESCEELLVNSHQIEVLGPLDLYIASSNLLVHPFLGIIDDYQMTYSKDEVDSIHLVSLHELSFLKPEVYGGKLKLQLDDDFPYSRIQGGKNYPWSENKRRITFYETSGITIWGMTAQILKNALEIINEK